MDMVEAGARVLYAAGEGDIEVGKVRIPAHCAARGIEVRSLRGKLMLCPAVPMLGDREQVEAFVAEYGDFAPNVVVIDTLATATAGEDENTSKFSGHLTDNGAIGLIKRAFKATVLVIAHEGKDASKGARGHSGLMGNVDAGLSVACAEGEARIDVFVAKMRGGRGKFHTYYAVDPASLTDNDVIPVPQLISEDEFKAMSPTAEREKVKEDGELAELLFVLRNNGACPGSTREWKPTGRNEDGTEIGDGGLDASDLTEAILEHRGTAATDDKKKAKNDIREALRYRVEKKGSRFAVYRVGKCGKDWRWAIPLTQVVEEI
jgi:hypothetical protein